MSNRRPTCYLWRSASSLIINIVRRFSSGSPIEIEIAASS
ncbi:MAG: hypothetical protein ACI9G1_000441, partial [Pirellulaceae bacterium]